MAISFYQVPGHNVGILRMQFLLLRLWYRDEVNNNDNSNKNNNNTTNYNNTLNISNLDFQLNKMLKINDQN